MLSFFNMIKVHFPKIKESDPDIEDVPQQNSESKTSTSRKVEVVGILTDIMTDQSVKLLVDDMVAEEKNRMEIICACMNNFAQFYYKMKLTDWKRIIYSYLDI